MEEESGPPQPDSLKYQHLDDLVAAIGLPKEKLCTYCWDGEETAQQRIPF